LRRPVAFWQPPRRAKPRFLAILFSVSLKQLVIRRDGIQKNVVDTMQTRMELYDIIDYHAYEQRLDRLFAKANSE